MENQLRKNLKISFFNKLRAFIQSKRLGLLGKGVFIDKDVSLLRFTKNIFIDENVVLKKGANICACNKNAKITIGKQTTIGFYTFIYSSESIIIGNNCLIAPFVYIVDSDHSIAKNNLINKQLNQSEPVIIKDDVWISTGAKILKGVIIGEGAVIAAGSVVKNSVLPYSIVAGIPAKIIGYRV